MSYVKGSQLPATSTVADTDTLIVTQEGDSKATKKVAKKDLLKEDRTRLTNLETDNTTNKSNITNLQKSLENKAEKNHNHAISNITNLQTTLDEKLSTNNGLIYAEKGCIILSNTQGYLGKDKTGATHVIGLIGNDNYCYLGGNLINTYIRSKNCPQYLDPSGNKYDIYHSGNFSKDITVLFERNNGTINKNINTCFNSSDGKFTAPEAGQYLVMCSGYKLSNSNMYVACVVGGENSNRNELYTTGSSGFTLITLNKGQTLAIYTATAENMNKTCISTNTIVNILIARIK